MTAVVQERCKGPTDPALLTDFVTNRSEAAFAVLVGRYGAMVHAVCRRVLGDVTAADDASQATFLLLARQATRLKNHCVAGWLHEAAWRVARQAQRSARRRVRHEQHALARSGTRAPEAVAAAREVGRAMDEEIRRLPRIYRGVVTLCLLQDRTKSEASRLLGWPEGTVAGRLSRAKALLRRRLERRGFAPAIAVAGLSLPAAQAQPHCLQAFLSNSTTLPTTVQQLVHDMRWMMFPKKYLSLVIVLIAFACTGLLATQLLATEDSPQGGVAAGQAADPKPAQGWDGLWLRLSQTLGGPEPNPVDISARPGWLLVDGNTIQDPPEGRRSFIPPGELRLDADGKQTFDIQHTLKNSGTKVIYRGRYQRLDDLLVICMCTTADGVRPTAFTTMGRLDVCLWTLQRAGEPAVARQRDSFTELDHYQITAAHLRKIGEAFRLFHSDFERLPQAVHEGFPWQGGKELPPYQSWRVALLPYLGHDNLFKEYRSAEPWDSEANKAVLRKMPVVFSHPGSEAHLEFKTHYRVFAYPGKVPAERPTRFAPVFRMDGDLLMGNPPDQRFKIKFTDITDGLANTLLVVESAEAVPWTQPEALVLEDDRSALPKLGADPKVKSFAVLFADGRVHRFQRDLPDPEQFERLFRACIGYRDGEAVNWAALGVKR